MKSSNLHIHNTVTNKGHRFLFFLIPSLVFIISLFFLLTYVWEEQSVASYQTESVEN